MYRAGTPGTMARTAVATSLPIISGITTSVSSRSTACPGAPAPADGPGPGGLGLHLVPVPGQDPAGQLAQAGLVLDQQDPLAPALRAGRPAFATRVRPQSRRCTAC